MLKELSSKQKIIFLQEWLPSLIEAVKKDIRQEHLKQDWLFVKKYLSGKSLHKLTTEDLVQAYTKAVEEEEKGEEIAEFLTNRWIMKHSDIYGYFEQELGRINPDFTEIKEVSSEEAQRMIEQSSAAFGAANAYIFCVLNSVAFPERSMADFQEQVKKEKSMHEAAKECENLRISEEELLRSHEREIARLTDKYEKKLNGLQKKYVTDIDALKKQISSLHKKLATK